MAKINQEEYELLKSLRDSWRWIARDRDRLLFVFNVKPLKGIICAVWDSAGWDDDDCLEIEDSDLFHFIQWEDGEPYNISELIEEYDNWVKDYEADWNKLFGREESEETEVNKQKLIEKWESAIEAAEFYGKGKEDRLIEYMLDFVDDLKRLDETEQPKITLQDVTDKLWEFPLNDRKFWLARLNDEFQEGYIVPLGLETTDGEEQYLTYNGSYFASRRNRCLQQTFAALEEIPEFYRDLAERVL